MRRGPAQLIEITGRYTWKPFPNAAWNAKPGSGPNVLNTAHGVAIDSKDRLGNRSRQLDDRQTPKLVAFDINTRKLVFRHDFPESTGPKGGIMQDLAVDGERGFVTLPIAVADPRSSWLTQIRTPLGDLRNTLVGC